MADDRKSFKLSADGALTVAVRDRWQADQDGDITDVLAVIGTAPAGSSAIFQIRIDGVVAVTGTLAAAATEVDVVTTVTAFTKGQTIDLNVTQIGSGTAGSDLDVTVQYVSR